MIFFNAYTTLTNVVYALKKLIIFFNAYTYATLLPIYLYENIVMDISNVRNFMVKF